MQRKTILGAQQNTSITQKCSKASATDNPSSYKNTNTQHKATSDHLTNKTKSQNHPLPAIIIPLYLAIKKQKQMPCYQKNKKKKKKNKKKKKKNPLQKANFEEM